MRFLFGMGLAALSAVVATEVPAAAAPFRDCADCPLMVTVPAGSFLMGLSADETSSVVGEGEHPLEVRRMTPQHEVRVGRFSMSVTEVTRDQFSAFVNETGYQATGHCIVYETNYTKGKDWTDPGFSQAGDHPVVCVNWYDANEYIRWLSQKTGKAYRLPSEAEWEYAARAGTSAPRYWGWDNSVACANANVSDQTRAAAHKLDAASTTEAFQCSDGYVYTAPVAQFRANAFGLNDMLGNVLEWTADCYNRSYTGAPSDGSAWLTGNCGGLGRGGSWRSPPKGVHSAYRSGVFDKVFRLSGTGFRVARTD